MGDIKRKKNKFKRPRKMFDSARIQDENKIVLEYGLKNKKEIWKAESEVSKIRKRAKMLIPKTDEDRKAFFGKLNRLGLKVRNTADALALTKKDLLERRIQTIVFRKGIIGTAKGARQAIVHKKISVDGKIVNIPSFWINSSMENKITFVNKVGKE